MNTKTNTISKRILSMLLATLMILGIFVSTGMLTVFGYDDLYEKIVDTHDVDNALDPAKPSKLEPGQVWTGKTVTDLGSNGKFKITLSASWAQYTDDTTKSLVDPLTPDTGITITDGIGDGFALGNLPEGVTDNLDGTVTWIVNNVTGNGSAAVEFFVTLKDTAVAGTTYYTNNGASASFQPRFGNTYYYTTEDFEEEVVVLESTDDKNWNNGHGINLLTITDKIVGVTFSLTTPNNFKVKVPHDNNNEHEFIFQTAYSNQTGEWILPSKADNYTWGVYWLKGGKEDKYYYVWVKGLEGPGVITRYNVYVNNNGGNTGKATRVTYWDTKYGQIKEKKFEENYTWVGDSIENTLNNIGWISLKNPTPPATAYTILYWKDQVTTVADLDHYLGESDPINGTVGQPISSLTDVQLNAKKDNIGALSKYYSDGTWHSPLNGEDDSPLLILTATLATNVINVVYSYQNPTFGKLTLDKSVDEGSLVTTEYGCKKTATYTLTVKNPNPERAIITLTDTMFDLAEPDPSANTLGKFNVNGTSDFSVTGNTATFTIAAASNATTPSVVTIKYTVTHTNNDKDTFSGTIAQSKPFPNKAQISWTFPDFDDRWNGTSDEKTTTVTVDPKGAKVITEKISVSDETVTSGETVVFKVTVENKGNKTANVSLLDEWADMVKNENISFAVENAESSFEARTTLPEGILTGTAFDIYPGEVITVFYSTVANNEYTTDNAIALGVIEDMKDDLAGLEADLVILEAELAKLEPGVKALNAAVDVAYKAYDSANDAFEKADAEYAGGLQDELENRKTVIRDQIDAAMADLEYWIMTSPTITPAVIEINEEGEEIEITPASDDTAEIEANIARLKGDIADLENDLLDLEMQQATWRDKHVQLQAAVNAAKFVYDNAVSAYETAEGVYNDKVREIDAKVSAIEGQVKAINIQVNGLNDKSGEPTEIKVLTNTIKAEWETVGISNSDASRAEEKNKEIKTVSTTVLPKETSNIVVNKKVGGGKVIVLENGLGREVTYTVTVKNIGNTTVTGITLIDEFGKIGVEATRKVLESIETLEPGESKEITYTQTILDNESYVNTEYYKNKVTASYTVEGIEDPIEDSSDAIVVVKPKQSVNIISIEKTATNVNVITSENGEGVEEEVGKEVTLGIGTGTAVVSYTVTAITSGRLENDQIDILNSLVTDKWADEECEIEIPKADFERTGDDTVYEWSYSVTFDEPGTYKNLVILAEKKDPDTNGGVTSGGDEDDETIVVNPEPFIELSVTKKVTQYNGGDYASYNNFVSTSGENENPLTIDNGAQALFEITITNKGNTDAIVTIEDTFNGVSITVQGGNIVTVPAGTSVAVYYLSDPLTGSTSGSVQFKNVVNVSGKGLIDDEEVDGIDRGELKEDEADVIIPTIGTYMVTVRYFDTAGNRLQSDVNLTTEFLNGQTYNASEFFAQSILANGVTYNYVRGDNLTGTINNANVTIDLIYNYTPPTTIPTDPTDPTEPETNPTDPTEPETNPTDPTEPETYPYYPPAEDQQPQLASYEPVTGNSPVRNAPSAPEEAQPEESAQEEVTNEPEESAEEEEIDIADEETPQSAPELPVDNTASIETEAKRVMEEILEDIEDEDIPTDGVPDLPKTGGLSGILTALAGLGLFGAGTVLNKKKKDEDDQ